MHYSLRHRFGKTKAAKMRVDALVEEGNRVLVVGPKEAGIVQKINGVIVSEPVTANRPLTVITDDPITNIIDAD